MSLLIKNTKIGSKSPPFIIAEMSGNHNQSLDRALKIVEAAANCGVHAIKLQTYTADTITLDVKDEEFFINDKKSLWNGKCLYELYDEAHTPWEWHEPIMNYATDQGLICFSSPFDDTSVEFLESLNVPAYKIASPEIIHLPLIKKVASTGKPIIISTGMASISEINDAITVAKMEGCKDIVLLKCTSSYPSTPKNSNISSIEHMKKLFNCNVGLSDHTLGIGAAVAAVAYGASVIEKHFTLDRSEGGVDSAFSLEPQEMKQLVIETKRAWESIGEISYGPLESEKNSLMFRRSIYVSKEIQKGETFNDSNIRIIRPGLGIHPKYFDLLIGRKAKQNLKKGTALNWDMIV